MDKAPGVFTCLSKKGGGRFNIFLKILLLNLKTSFSPEYPKVNW